MLTYIYAVIEKKVPPIFKTPADKNRLHTFTALPQDLITVLAARRCPAVTTPLGNGAKYISIFTSTGFRKVTVPEYTAAVTSLQPDIAVPIADLMHTSTNPPPKKLIRMSDRTEAWTEQFIESIKDKNQTIFAPILAMEHPMQWAYLKSLDEDAAPSLSGLAIYGVDILPDLDSYANLSALPKLSFDAPRSPHDILRQIALGIDICTLPFINTTSDAGIAMTFAFPPSSTSPQPLGTDMWSPEHVTSVTPLQENCPCYACKTHHRAYIHHLLNAKEMLGWTLLQIHNHQVVSDFFAGVRRTIAEGGDKFKEASEMFALAYETEFPEGTGERPRARGYHFKSEAAADKINKAPWKELDGQTAVEA